jgi:hypothetical protein
VTGRTLWFESLAAAKTNECLGHEESAHAACPAGAVVNFTYNYEVVTPGVLTRLYAKSEQTPGAASSYVITVRVNGVNSTLTCTIATGQHACEGASTVAVVAGDEVQVQFVEVGANTPDTALKTYVTFS